jgi:hypothetical protein
MVRKFLFSLLLFSALGALAGRGWHALRDGFDVRRITTVFPKGVPAPIPGEVLSKIDQSFSYLARGRQSFVFVSEDGQYVLKLPRSDLPKLPFWKRSLFPERSWRASFEKKELRRKRALDSFELAYTQLKEETGLVYLHLARTEGSHEVEIVDRIGRRHRVCLDKTLFFLQKRYPLAFPELKSRLEKGDEEGVKTFLNAFLDMVLLRAKKGIFNSDSEFLMNFGIDQNRIYQIDIGSFHGSDPSSFVTCFLEAVSQLKKRLPLEWAAWVDKRAEMILAEQM